MGWGRCPNEIKGGRFGEATPGGTRCIAGDCHDDVPLRPGRAHGCTDAERLQDARLVIALGGAAAEASLLDVRPDWTAGAEAWLDWLVDVANTAARRLKTGLRNTGLGILRPFGALYPKSSSRFP